MGNRIDDLINPLGDLLPYHEIVTIAKLYFIVKIENEFSKNKSRGMPQR